ncbi:MAG TPA: LacI family DNA-binding transcriptional regulator [Gaiellaceae bacterium]|nr:LacI family DNA-binding transcriptional regulator [Gaiellaceae bacterium]
MATETPPPGPELERRRHPTLVDVARIAQVAPSTASRALNASPRISETTRRRVNAAALRLGYQPNRIAQSLRARSANFVGIVVPDIGVGFYSRFVKGAQDVLERAGHQVLVMSTEREAERETTALRTLEAHRVGGILLATSAAGVAEPGVPTVFFDNVVPGRGVASVACANRDGIDLLVRHLAGHGHTRVAYIGGPPTQTSGAERLDGFRRAVRRLALDDRSRYVELGDAVWSPGSGAAALRRLLALEEPPTAVVTSGDTLALGAMSACREAGLRLPGDMALVSFDDPAFGDLLDPPVTALTRPETEMGKLAATLLLQALSPGAAVPPTEVRLPVELVIRRSCGCP